VYSGSHERHLTLSIDKFHYRQGDLFPVDDSVASHFVFSLFLWRLDPWLSFPFAFLTVLFFFPFKHQILIWRWQYFRLSSSLISFYWLDRSFRNWKYIVQWDPSSFYIWATRLVQITDGTREDSSWRPAACGDCSTWIYLHVLAGLIFSCLFSRCVKQGENVGSEKTSGLISHMPHDPKASISLCSLKQLW
jgi:hypothetical protein